MAVTPEDVGVEVGIPTPTAAQETQWQSWIGQTYYLVQRRYGLGYSDPTEADVDYVVLMVVASKARNVDFATQVDVSIDDGRISRRYSTDSGRTSLEDWWDFLDPDPVDTTGGAFTISPTGEADVAYSDSLRNWRDVYDPSVE